MATVNREPDRSNDETVEIPGRTAPLASSPGPPRFVTLPLVAGPDTFKALLVALLQGVFGLGLFGLGLLILAATFFASDLVRIPIFLGCALLLLAVGGLSASFALFGFNDLAKGRPLLVIDKTGLHDLRLGNRIEWRQVKRIKSLVVGGPLLGVQIRTHQPVGARHNPLRWEASADLRWRRTDELFVPVNRLDRDAHVLAETMIALARRHGAEVEPLRQAI